ncbi:MAG: efflux RND transporter periplasmic adaptor subunit [Parvularculaceae bacterium]
MAFPRVFVAGAVLGLLLGGAAVWLSSGGSDAGSKMRAQGAGGAAGFSRGAMTPAVTTAAVEEATIGRTIDAVGSGRAVKSVTLVSEATGLVEDVAPRAGEAVRAGDVILKLDDAEQKIAVARTRAQYPIAKANWDSFAALFKDESASRLEADTAFNQYKAAEADLKSAEFALKQRTIRAPFDGVVGLTDIEAGDYVRAGDIVTTIDDLSSLIIEFAVPQEEAADVEIGQPVTATLAGGSGKRMEGAVSAIDSRVDLASRTLRIEATFENHGGALIPGATYAVSTTNAGSAALSVPGLTVQWDRTGAFVWKIQPDGAAVRVGVTVLQRRDETALVSGDLAAGDIVIVEGADRIRPGMSFPPTGVSASGVASVSAGMQ